MSMNRRTFIRTLTGAAIAAPLAPALAMPAAEEQWRKYLLDQWIREFERDLAELLLGFAPPGEWRVNLIRVPDAETFARTTRRLLRP